MRMKRLIQKTTVVLVLVLVLTGCGKSPQPNVDMPESEAIELDDTPYYSLTEIDMPDPDEALRKEGVLENDLWWVKEEKVILANSVMYRLVNIKESLSDEKVIGHIQKKIYIQKLESPYTEWINYEVHFPGMEDQQVMAENFALNEENELILEIYDYMFDANGQLKNMRYLADYTLGENATVLAEIKGEGGFNTLIKTGEGSIYRIENWGKTVVAYDEKGQKKESIDLNGQLSGRLWNPAEKTCLWYGMAGKGVSFWNEPNGRQVYPDMEEVDRFAFQIGISKKGELYLADKKAVYRYDGKASEQLFVFSQKDYVLEEIRNLCVCDDDAILMYVEFEGNKHLLLAKELDRDSLPQKQEITIAFVGVWSDMHRVIANYNRRNEFYHVTVREKPDNEDLEDYMKKIQLEISAGTGPDLVTDFLIDARNGARNGYFCSLEHVISDKDAYLQSALDGGRINGVIYGIPYECSALHAVFLKKLTGDKEYWTVEEMMQAVENSNADMLMRYYDATSIINMFGLQDVENKDYIDWENRKSHLNEAPFLRLMEFAKKYQDKVQRGDENTAKEYGDKKREGTIAGEQLGIYSVTSLDYGDVCFGDNEVSYIGYPGVSRPSVYMSAQYLYMNQASKNREGVEDFLRYLLSEKAQRIFIGGSHLQQGRMSVRWDMIEEAIEESAQMAKKPSAVYNSTGIHWVEDGLDEEQAERYRSYIRQAKVTDPRIGEIMAIVYEELQPFFEDKRSAKDCAEILHNRVQLYLNE